MKKMEKLQGKREKFYTEVFEVFGHYKIYHFPLMDIVIKEGNQLIRVDLYKAEETPRNKRSMLQNIAAAISAIFWANFSETNSVIYRLK